MSSTTVQIEVTQERIDKGIRGDCFLCAIAIAIEAAVPGLAPRVNPYHVWIGPPKDRVTVPLPTVARDFIQSWDHCLHVDPIAFPLPIPSHLIATGQEVGR